jgi:hypothetical protein
MGEWKEGSEFFTGQLFRINYLSVVLCWITQEKTRNSRYSLETTPPLVIQRLGDCKSDVTG